MKENGSITCRKCQSLVPAGDQFCPTCGKKITELDRSIGAALGPEAALEARRSDAVRKAVRWMIILGVLFIVFGTSFGVKNASEAARAKDALASFDDGMVWPVEVNGKSMTVGELRRRIDFELYSLFVVNYLLALAMFGLSFWARKSPFPAMMTALCLYLAVNVLNAIVEPASLAQGWLVKILFVAAMIGGLKAALAARAQQRLDGPPASPAA
jgi:RNA polymerase subunit RPABC4/transcription elongation factor Spt4